MKIIPVMMLSLSLFFITFTTGCAIGFGEDHPLNEKPNIKLDFNREGDFVKLVTVGGTDLRDLTDLKVSIGDKEFQQGIETGSTGKYPIVYPVGNCQVELRVRAYFKNESRFNYYISGYPVFNRYLRNDTLCTFQSEHWRNDRPEILVNINGSKLKVLNKGGGFSNEVRCWSVQFNGVTEYPLDITKPGSSSMVSIPPCTENSGQAIIIANFPDGYRQGVIFYSYSCDRETGKFKAY
jgi:hypothetical protein